MERAILQGDFLTSRKNQIEREAILGLYPKPRELEAAERLARRQAARALLDKPETELSPDERRLVGKQRHEHANLLVHRIFGNAPRPGPARQKLLADAIAECQAVRRLLEALAQATADIDDVGMTYWALHALARFAVASGDTRGAAHLVGDAIDLLGEASQRAPDEPSFRRLIAESQAVMKTLR
jgi:hypothetical protein